MKKIMTVSFLVLVYLCACFMYFTSSTSRIELVNNGNTNNSIEIISNKKLDITEFTDNNFVTSKSIAIEIPNSIINSKEQIRVKIIGDGELILRLKAPDKTGVVYSDVKVDEKDLMSNKIDVFSYNPQTYNVPVGNNQELLISFKHRFNLQTIDIYYQTYLIVILLLLLFLLIKAKDKNWLEFLKEKYSSISSVYRKAFWLVFVITNIVFVFHTANMMIGNHSWNILLDGFNLKSNLFMGRYGSHVMKVLLFNGHYISIITTVVSFFALALTSVLLAKYWGFEKKLHVYLICGLLLAIQPFTLEWLFYVETLPDFFIAPLVILVGFILSEQSINTDKIYKIILYNLLAVVCFNYAISVYPPMINTIVVILSGRIVIDFIKRDTNINALSVVFRQKFAMINFFIAACLFKIIIVILNKNHMLADIYTIKDLSIDQIPHRIIECIYAAFFQLFSYQFPFMPNILTEIFSILLIILVAMIIMDRKYSVSTKLWALLFIVLTLFATKFSSVISERPMFYEPRLDIFGLVYFRILIVGLILSTVTSINVKNITIYLISFVLLISAINDFYAQGVWHLGYEAEKMAWNRVISELESHPRFNKNSRYIYLQVGPERAYRERFFQSDLKTRSSDGLLSKEYSSSWHPFVYVDFYYERGFLSDRYSTVFSDLKNDENYRRNVFRLYRAGIFDEAREKNDKIYIYEDIIMYVADKQALPAFIDQITAELGGATP